MRYPLPSLCALALVLGACTGDNPDAADQGANADMSIASLPDGDVGVDQSTPPDSQPGSTVDVECANLAAAVCDRFNKCSPFELRYYYGDTAGCAARLKLTCAPYVALSGSSWTIDRLHACAMGYANATCGEYFDPAGPAACQPQPGKLADGAVCANSNQCQSAFCNLANTGCGTCIKPAQKGEACSATKPCGIDLTCATNVCAPSGAVGDACGNGKAPCGTGLYCATAMCAKQLAVGATCSGSATVTDCDFTQGLFCNTTSKKCEAYKLAAAGEACGAVANATVLCDTGGTCAGATAMRKCSPPAKEGAACGPTGNGDSCELPAACTANTCQVFAPATCK